MGAPSEEVLGVGGEGEEEPKRPILMVVVDLPAGGRVLINNIGDRWRLQQASWI